MSIKNTFSIKDLENLSGIKAHTIRIWEKRYEMLEPMRTDTNIRLYDIKNLTKLLNITVLLENNVKISKIAELSDNDANRLVRELSIKNRNPNSAIQTFKISMLRFDQRLFENTYNQLLTEYSFREIFYQIFIPILNDVGILWQTESITPAHEHFLSTLIQQKLLYNIERVQNNPLEESKTFILFLPEHEMHDLGILYLHFELLLKGYRSIYLGPSVPTESLLSLRDLFETMFFVSFLTVSPTEENALNFVLEFEKKILKPEEKLFLLGKNTKFIPKNSVSKQTFIFESIKDFVEKV